MQPLRGLSRSRTPSRATSWQVQQAVYDYVWRVDAKPDLYARVVYDLSKACVQIATPNRKRIRGALFTTVIGRNSEAAPPQARQVAGLAAQAHIAPAM